MTLPPLLLKHATLPCNPDLLKARANKPDMQHLGVEHHEKPFINNGACPRTNGEETKTHQTLCLKRLRQLCTGGVLSS